MKTNKFKHGSFIDISDEHNKIEVEYLCQECGSKMSGAAYRRQKGLCFKCIVKAN